MELVAAGTVVTAARSSVWSAISIRSCSAATASISPGAVAMIAVAATPIGAAVVGVTSLASYFAYNHFISEDDKSTWDDFINPEVEPECWKKILRRNAPKSNMFKRMMEVLADHDLVSNENLKNGKWTAKNKWGETFTVDCSAKGSCSC